MNQRQENLFEQLAHYRSELLHFLEHVSEEEANIIPTGFHNNIRWNLGHLYLDQYLWIEALTKEKDTELNVFIKWFGFGTSPNHFDKETPTLEELKSTWLGSLTKSRNDMVIDWLKNFPLLTWACKPLNKYCYALSFMKGCISKRF